MNVNRREAIGAMIGAVAGAAIPVVPVVGSPAPQPTMTVLAFPIAIPAGSTIEGVEVFVDRDGMHLYFLPNNHA